jgi:hypothetical protein
MRSADDFYETPSWAVRAVLEEMPWASNAKINVLEPMAGRGAIVREVRARWPNAVITACEIDEDRATNLRDAGSDYVYVGDVFTRQFASAAPNATEQFDLCIGNPAFSLAMPTIELGLRVAAHTTMLERLNYLGSQDRAPFWRQYAPNLLILPRRPSFAQSLKCKGHEPPRKSCGWKETRMLDEETPKVCPNCGGKVTKVTSDSVEYAWFSWSPGSTGGHWAIAETKGARG